MTPHALSSGTGHCLAKAVPWLQCGHCLQCTERSFGAQ